MKVQMACEEKVFFGKKILSIIRSWVGEWDHPRLSNLGEIQNIYWALKISSMTTSFGFGRSPFCAAWITGWGGEGQTLWPFLTMCWMGAGGEGGGAQWSSPADINGLARALTQTSAAAVSCPALLSDIKSALIERLRHFASLIWHHDNAIIRQQQLEENFWQDQ